MADGKIRVKSANEYEIEVNDRGDVIVFDVSDTSLTTRLYKMFEDVDKMTADYAAQALVIDNRPDEPLHTTHQVDAEGNPGEERVLITRNQVEGAKLIEDFYAQSRTALDIFLGEGACQKIFGDKNYLTMFDDLIEQLQPHFEKMGLDAEKMRHSAAAKHAPNRAARRALQ